MTDDDPRHGSVNGYHNLKCRCQPCRVAWADSMQKYRARRIAAGERIVHGRFTTKPIARHRKAREQ